MGLRGWVRREQERRGQCHFRPHGSLQVNVVSLSFSQANMYNRMSGKLPRYKKERILNSWFCIELFTPESVNLMPQVPIPCHVGSSQVQSQGLWRVVDVRRWYEASPVLWLCKIQNTFLVFYLISSSNVCAARYSGVISYKHSSTRVVSGCTQKPSPGNQVSWILTNWPWQAKNTINWKTIFSSVQTTRMTQDPWFWQRISQKRRNPSWSKVGRWSIMHKVWQ